MQSFKTRHINLSDHLDSFVEQCLRGDRDALNGRSKLNLPEGRSSNYPTGKPIVDVESDGVPSAEILVDNAVRSSVGVLQEELNERSRALEDMTIRCEELARQNDKLNVKLEKKKAAIASRDELTKVLEEELKQRDAGMNDVQKLLEVLQIEAQELEKDNRELRANGGKIEPSQVSSEYEKKIAEQHATFTAAMNKLKEEKSILQSEKDELHQKMKNIGIAAARSSDNNNNIDIQDNNNINAEVQENQLVLTEKIRQTENRLSELAVENANDKWESQKKDKIIDKLESQLAQLQTNFDRSQEELFREKENVAQLHGEKSVEKIEILKEKMSQLVTAEAKIVELESLLTPEQLASYNHGQTNNDVSNINESDHPQTQSILENKILTIEQERDDLIAELIETLEMVNTMTPQLKQAQDDRESLQHKLDDSNEKLRVLQQTTNTVSNVDQIQQNGSVQLSTLDSDIAAIRSKEWEEMLCSQIYKNRIIYDQRTNKMVELAKQMMEKFKETGDPNEAFVYLELLEREALGKNNQQQQDVGINLETVTALTTDANQNIDSEILTPRALQKKFLNPQKSRDDTLAALTSFNLGMEESQKTLDLERIRIENILHQNNSDIDKILSEIELTSAELEACEVTDDVIHETRQQNAVFRRQLKEDREKLQNAVKRSHDLMEEHKLVLQASVLSKSTGMVGSSGITSQTQSKQIQVVGQDDNINQLSDKGLNSLANVTALNTVNEIKDILNMKSDSLDYAIPEQIKALVIKVQDLQDELSKIEVELTDSSDLLERAYKEIEQQKATIVHLCGKLDISNITDSASSKLGSTSLIQDSSTMTISNNNLDFNVDEIVQAAQKHVLSSEEELRNALGQVLDSIECQQILFGSGSESDDSGVNRILSSFNNYTNKSLQFKFQQGRISSSEAALSMSNEYGERLSGDCVVIGNDVKFEGKDSQSDDEEGNEENLESGDSGGSINVNDNGNEVQHQKYVSSRKSSTTKQDILSEIIFADEYAVRRRMSAINRSNFQKLLMADQAYKSGQKLVKENKKSGMIATRLEDREKDQENHNDEIDNDDHDMSSSDSGFFDEIEVQDNKLDMDNNDESDINNIKNLKSLSKEKVIINVKDTSESEILGQQGSEQSAIGQDKVSPAISINNALSSETLNSNVSQPQSNIGSSSNQSKELSNTNSVTVTGVTGEKTTVQKVLSKQQSKTMPIITASFNLGGSKALKSINFKRSSFDGTSGTNTDNELNLNQQHTTLQKVTNTPSERQIIFNEFGSAEEEVVPVDSTKVSAMGLEPSCSTATAITDSQNYHSHGSHLLSPDSIANPRRRKTATGSEMYTHGSSISQSERLQSYRQVRRAKTDATEIAKNSRVSKSEAMSGKKSLSKEKAADADSDEQEQDNLNDQEEPGPGPQQDKESDPKNDNKSGGGGPSMYYPDIDDLDDVEYERMKSTFFANYGIQNISESANSNTKDLGAAASGSNIMPNSESIESESEVPQKNLENISSESDTDDENQDRILPLNNRRLPDPESMARQGRRNSMFKRGSSMFG